MGLLREPTSCVPCGHTWCAACLKEANGACPECHSDEDGIAPRLTIYPSVTVASLTSLVSKFEFQKQTLGTLAEAAAATHAGGGGSGHNFGA